MMRTAEVETELLGYNGTGIFYFLFCNAATNGEFYSSCWYTTRTITSDNGNASVKKKIKI